MEQQGQENDLDGADGIQMVSFDDNYPTASEKDQGSQELMASTDSNSYAAGVSAMHYLTIHWQCF